MNEAVREYLRVIIGVALMLGESPPRGRNRAARTAFRRATASAFLPIRGTSMTIISRSFFLLLFAASLGLAACEHTIRGAGQDVKETGQAVEDAVQ
jgi:predicted small secreted protein